MINFDLSKYDLFIVDFDGTIVDTMVMWRHICPNFILSINKTPHKDLFNRITSLTNIEISRYIRDEYLAEYSYDEVEEMFFNFIKEQYIKQDIKPNATKLLEELNQYGKVVLYSASAGMLLDVLLDKFDLRKYFKNIYSGSDLKIAKKDGTGYLKVIEFEGGCNKALAVEDALHAIKGASSQNIDILAIVDILNINDLDEIKTYSKYILDLNEYE